MSRVGVRSEDAVVEAGLKRAANDLEEISPDMPQGIREEAGELSRALRELSTNPDMTQLHLKAIEAFGAFGERVDPLCGFE